MTAAIRKVFVEKPGEFDPRNYLVPNAISWTNFTNISCKMFLAAPTRLITLPETISWKLNLDIKGLIYRAENKPDSIFEQFRLLPLYYQTIKGKKSAIIPYTCFKPAHRRYLLLLCLIHDRSVKKLKKGLTDLRCFARASCWLKKWTNPPAVSKTVINSRNKSTFRQSHLPRQKVFRKLRETIRKFTFI